MTHTAEFFFPPQRETLLSSVNKENTDFSESCFKIEFSELNSLLLSVCNLCKKWSKKKAYSYPSLAIIYKIGHKGG